MPSLLKRFGEEAATHKAELAGLGILAVPSVDNAQAHIRAGIAGDYNKAGVEKRTLLPEAIKPATEIGGLGVLALPSAAHLLSKHGARLDPEADLFKTAVSACLDELEKLGAVSDEEARRALDRYDDLEKSRPSVGQVGRYGALGAGAGMLMHAVGRGVEGGKLTPRSVGAAALTGAIGMGGTPLVRSALDRAAEKRTLRKYMTQEHVGDYGSSPGAETAAAGTPTGLQKV